MARCSLSLGRLARMLCVQLFLSQISVPGAEAANSSSVEIYDYIIVGGGTAGLALSTRLSQLLPGSSILVLEAGPAAPHSPNILIPGLKGSNLNGPHDWNLTTVPQAQLNGRSVTQPRGRVLGGSTALNLMVWDRAAAAEYDVWAQPHFGGDEGWGWESLYGAMLRAENFTRPADEGVYGNAGVAYGGPVQMVVNRYVPEQQLAFIPAMVNLGAPLNQESLGGNPLGAGRQPSTLRSSDYSRSYATAYLPLAGSNVNVVTDVTVTTVLFEDEKDASGELVARGVTLADGPIINARKEVILSAGSLKSPQILESSGIGNSRILSAAGIEPLLDLPGVGENLQDHVKVQNVYQLKANYSSFDRIRYDAAYAAQQLDLWYRNETSAYDYTGSTIAFLTWSQVAGANTSFVPSPAAANDTAAAAMAHSAIDEAKLGFLLDEETNAPALELLFSDGYFGAASYPAANTSLYGANFFTLIAGVQHLFSTGSVHVDASAEAPATAAPRIDPRYLEHPYDAAALREAAKYLRRVAATPPLSAFVEAEYEPGLEVKTDEQWEAYVRQAGSTLFHPTGTCAMMERAIGGVVDGRLRVHGTANLRVVDASVIPVQISAHIQTAVYGIAERAARLIAGS
ncbi:alcohol oxidase [Phyllosticta citricarpa]|uniref:Alcohol oxidase n=1 Tax=Phyllosticta citricarpa TaxID=55181 RepID=A0ABR1MFZ9_9PEZI